MNLRELIVIALFVPGYSSFALDQSAVNQSVKAAVAVPGAATVAVTGNYLIGPADVLNITVWKEATLSGNLLVRPDGMITMPLLGDVSASGLTPLQLGGQIQAKLKSFIQDPLVTVEISQIHSKTVYLLGEVVKKGPIELTSGMTLLEAISSAGGLTDFANAKKIYVLRNELGKRSKILAHYKDALKGNSASNLILQSGDTIVVP
jgi:polysaccharide export outer membrane protein